MSKSKETGSGGSQENSNDPRSAAIEKVRRQQQQDIQDRRKIAQEARGKETVETTIK